MLGKTFKLGFNPAISKTVWAGLGVGFVIVLEQVQAGRPVTWATIATACLAVLGAIGVRDAIAKNGVGSDATKADEANNG